MLHALSPALDGLGKALGRLETVIDREMKKTRQMHEEPQLGLAPNHAEINRRVTAKIDGMINRLETILAQE